MPYFVVHLSVRGRINSELKQNQKKTALFVQLNVKGIKNSETL